MKRRIFVILRWALLLYLLYLAAGACFPSYIQRKREKNLKITLNQPLFIQRQKVLTGPAS